jgi:hypothetical protein
VVVGSCPRSGSALSFCRTGNTGRISNRRRSPGDSDGSRCCLRVRSNKDGSRPKLSDIFVQSTRYWGLLGGFEEIENGVGTISLAEGFEYVANAQVECAGRDGPEQRLAIPSQKFKVADGQTQTKLRLFLLSLGTR